MSFSFQQLFKSQESVRGDNRKVDKRVSIDLEERRNVQVEMDSKVERSSREQRILERELNRIRQGGYRRPVQTDTTDSRKAGSPGRNSQPLNVSVVTSLTPIRITLDEVSSPEQRNILELSPRQCESSRSTKQDSFSHTPYLITPDQPMHIDVRASPVFRHAFQQYMVAQPPRLPPLNEHDVHEAERTRGHLRAEGNALDIIPEVMKQSSELQAHAITVDVGSRLPKDTDVSQSQTPRSEKNQSDTSKKKHNTKKTYDLAHLSSLDIHNIRANVSKRLSQLPHHNDGANLPTPRKKLSRTQSLLTPREKHSKDSGSKVLQDRRNLSVIGAKALGELPEKHRRSRRGEQAHKNSDKHTPDIKHTFDRRTAEVQQAMDLLDSKEKPKLDPHKYNPDGSLKTALNLPSFQKRFEEAKKARYIRHKDLKFRERELSIRDMFNMQI